MAKSKGMPLGTFLKLYSSEKQCEDRLAALRWKDGYVCPKCGSQKGRFIMNIKSIEMSQHDKEKIFGVIALARFAVHPRTHSAIGMHKTIPRKLALPPNPKCGYPFSSAEESPRL